MALLHWEAQFETGNDAYDDQHRALFALVNQMHKTLHPWNPDEEDSLRLRFQTFTDLVELHSNLENMLMHRLGYSTESDHAGAHHLFLAQLKVLVTRNEFGPPAHPEILQALKQFQSHFEGQDEQLFLDLLRARRGTAL